MYYNQEEIKKAKEINLIQLITSNGYKVKKEGNAYNVIGFGGLYIFEKNQNNTQGFYWHSKNIKGNTIDFCKEFFKDDYLNAIERLLKFSNGSVQSLDSKIQEKSNESVQSLDTISKEFILPERDKEIKNVYAYLTNTRMISKSLINECIKSNLIRQFKENKYIYAGFIGKDINNKPQYLMLRSTLTGSSFKKEYKNSNKEYGFKIFNKESVQSLDNEINIHIFESPIDLLSYMTIFPKLSLNSNAFLAMGGTSSKTLHRFINDYKPNISQITICFDNDEAGITGSNKIKEELKDKYRIVIDKPISKDYNKQLVSIRLNNNESALNNTLNLKP